jgi:hypothetical protein
MLSKLLLLIVLVFSFQVHSQSHFEVGYSFGANAITSRTILSDNMTWGYYTPPLPNTWSNHWSIGYGTSKNRFYLALDGGGLGPMWISRTYPDKYSFDDMPSPNGASNMSTQTGFRGSSRHNSNLLKFSLLHKHVWLQSRKVLNKSIIGVGYLKTRVRNGSANIGSSFYLNDSIGWISHGMTMDKYEYFRNQNFYLIAGYEFTFKISDHLNWNAQIMYNQGLYKMIRWHTYRTYSESLTGYTEFDEQWSFTKLSYFAFLTGITYEFDFKKKR